MPDDVRDKIEEAAQKPLNVRGDLGQVEQHPLPDQIAADRYLSSKDAVDKLPHRGIRFNRLQPPGTTSGPAQ